MLFTATKVFKLMAETYVQSSCLKNNACLIITRTGLVISIKEGEQVECETLPESFNLFPKLHVYTKGVLCRTVPDEATDDFEDINKIEMPLTSGERNFLGMLSPDLDITKILNTYGRLMNPVLSCSFSSLWVDSIRAPDGACYSA